MSGVPRRRGHGRHHRLELRVPPYAFDRIVMYPPNAIVNGAALQPYSTAKPEGFGREPVSMSGDELEAVRRVVAGVPRAQKGDS